MFHSFSPLSAERRLVRLFEGNTVEAGNVEAQDQTDAAKKTEQLTAEQKTKEAQEKKSDPVETKETPEKNDSPSVNHAAESIVTELLGNTETGVSEKQKNVETVAQNKATLKMKVNQQVVDAKETKRAQEHNKEADTAANTLAAVSTVGLAPESKTKTETRTKEAESTVAVASVEQPVAAKAESPVEAKAEQPQVQTAQIDAGTQAEQASKLDQQPKQQSPEGRQLS